MPLRSYLTSHKISLTVFGGLALVYFLTASGRVGTIDAELMLKQSRSLLAGTVVIDDSGLLQGGDGQHYSHFGILTSVCWLPFLLLGRGMTLLLPQFSRGMWEEFAVSFASIPLALMLLGYLRWVWQRQELDEKRIAPGLLVMGLGTLIFAYAKLLSSDLVMALALFAGWAHVRHGTSRWSCVLAGLWLGLALLSRKQAQIIVPVLGLGMLLFLFQAGRKRDVGMLFLGGLPPLLLMLSYNWSRWGNPLLDPYPPFDRQTPETLWQWGYGFYRLLFGEYSGFFLFNLPMLVLLLVGGRGWFARDRLECLLVATLFGTHLSFLAFMGSRLGPISFGPRLLLWCLPFMALAWAHWPEAGGKRWKGLLAVAAVAGLGVQLLGVAIDPLAAWQRRQALENEELPILTAHWAELKRVLGEDASAPVPDAHKDLPVYRHPAFQEPDFWWLHLSHRRQETMSPP
jgi:hypothetical protein